MHSIKAVALESVEAAALSSPTPTAGSGSHGLEEVAGPAVPVQAPPTKTVAPPASVPATSTAKAAKAGQSGGEGGGSEAGPSKVAETPDPEPSKKLDSKAKAKEVTAEDKKDSKKDDRNVNRAARSQFIFSIVSVCHLRLIS